MFGPTPQLSHNPRGCPTWKSSLVQIIGPPYKSREMKESKDPWRSTMAKRVGMLLFFCAFRIGNVFLIQSKFDPDEYFQQLEPAYCEVFMKAGKPCPGLTWEWKRRPPTTEINSLSDFMEVGMKGPLRSYASILPAVIFYHAIKYIGLDSPWAVARGPVFLNAILVAAPTDWSVWYLSQWLVPQSQSRDGSSSTSQSRWCTYCVLSSWFCAYALVRTYSNSLETLLLMLSVCLVGPELVGNPNFKSSHNISRACLAFFIGGLSCSIRFTSLAGFVPLGILLSLQRLSRSALSVLIYLICVCAVFGLVGIVTTLALDHYMYGFSVFPVLASIDFNVLKGNGRLYGTHPFFWYVTAGIPQISGILTPFLVLDLVDWKSWSTGRRNLWVICICYILAHSISEHKELRFLLPVLPLFCILCGDRLRIFAKTWYRGRALLIFGALANLAAVIYLGLVHQHGPIEVNRRIIQLVKHEPQTYSIHYLMECHSTPLLSHLHSPPVNFEPWALDCSPSCRADPKMKCESDLFAQDPGQFMEDTYFHCSDVEEGTCVTDLRILYPDFLVANAGDMPAMRSRIATMGMKEVGRFVNGVNGIRLGERFTLGSDAFAKNSFSTLSVLGGAVVLCLDEFVLFENSQINPRY